MKRSSASSHTCCYPTCPVNINLGRPSQRTRFEVLKQFNFFITDTAKVCRNHLTVDEWMNAFDNGYLNNFSVEHLNQIHKMLRDPRPSFDLNASSGNQLDLVANPKAASSHVDAVYSRKCINFILRSTIGKLLSEKAQSSACKEIVHIIAKQMSTIDFNPENAKDSNQETLFSQHLLVCALQELGNLVMSLGTTSQNLLSDQHLIFVDTICAVLIHPCAAARLAAAWCLRYGAIK